MSNQRFALISCVLLYNIFSLLFAYKALSSINPNDLIIENKDFKLIIGSNAISKSLIHKASGKECLDKSEELAISSITEYRPYDNELFLTYPAKARTFLADTAYFVNGFLKIGYEDIAYEATISLELNDNYIGFKLVDLDYEIEKIGVKRKTEIDEFVLFQLPIMKRKYFGEWLNVIWDNDISINLLATDIYSRIDSKLNKGNTILYAGMDNSVKLMNVGAALIVTDTDKLLDRIDVLEENFDLPRGVQSRRSKEYGYSYYEMRNANLNTIDEHISYAKKGGFKMMVIYYTDFSAIVGHFPWRREYSNGIHDLKVITNKIRDAGIIPGIHIHYNKANIYDFYVRPIPDSRLNLVRTFTLSKNITSNDSIIYVEENPENCTLEDRRRLLKLGNEIIEYTSYSSAYPYAFFGCKRGVWGSEIGDSNRGVKFGLLDVDTWPDFIRFDQNTSIQQEVAQRLGDIYNQAGFEFVYFDGAEDVHPPYWYNVSKSQNIVYSYFNTKPMFSEGAIKSHYGWHILSRGNAFDLFRPEDIREATQRYAMKAAEYIAQDFTSINFGWNDYLAPSIKTIGMQPDMYEYICSRAAAWSSPIALMGKLDELKMHPRTNDNLQVIRNWEEARLQGFITSEYKEMLKSKNQEHILLKNSQHEFELYPYKEISSIAIKYPDLRAFVFEREGKCWIVYWHIRGEGNILLPKIDSEIFLYESFNQKPKKVSSHKAKVPVNNRKFITVDVSIDEAMDWFSQLTLL